MLQQFSEVQCEVLFVNISFERSENCVNEWILFMFHVTSYIFHFLRLKSHSFMHSRECNLQPEYIIYAFFSFSQLHMLRIKQVCIILTLILPSKERICTVELLTAFQCVCVDDLCVSWHSFCTFRLCQGLRMLMHMWMQDFYFNYRKALKAEC